MDAFEIAQLIEQRNQQQSPYLEFLRTSSLSLGVYMLPAGSVDPQQPHKEDEVYYVVSGRGSIAVGDEDRAVVAGSVVFVEGGVKHRFHSLTEDLVVLVFFAPPESA
jgi:mannose-6-phosphate isomerase-like protein (cupin superfamily)